MTREKPKAVNYKGNVSIRQISGLLGGINVYTEMWPWKIQLNSILFCSKLSWGISKCYPIARDFLFFFNKKRGKKKKNSNEDLWWNIPHYFFQCKLSVFIHSNITARYSNLQMLNTIVTIRIIKVAVKCNRKWAAYTFSHGLVSIMLLSTDDTYEEWVQLCFLRL